MNTFTKILSQLAFMLCLALALLFTTGNTYAQRIKTIGNKPRSGSSSSSYDVVKGGEVAIKMKAGKKPVQLLKLNFTVYNQHNDTLKFRVNAYEFNDSIPGKNFIEQQITSVIPPGQNRIVTDLSSYNIMVKGTVLAGIEWLETKPGANPLFATGLFNGGTYHKNNGAAKWDKTPVVGADFNMLVKK